LRTWHVHPPCDGFPWQIFELDDTTVFLTVNACLNDMCINGCAVLLYSAFLSTSAQ
ncbi:hypothetical protein PISMIDRAFT_122802, partial [Pisolithus microcarpus 441]